MSLPKHCFHMGDSLTSLRKLRISCEDDVEILRCHFEDAISCDEGEYLDVYSTLLETPPGVLEFLVSCSGTRNIDNFRDYLLRSVHQPSNRPTVVHQRIIERLGRFLVSSPPHILSDRSLLSTYAEATKLLDTLMPPTTSDDGFSLAGLQLGATDGQLPKVERLESPDKARSLMESLRQKLKAYLSLCGHDDFREYVTQLLLPATPAVVENHSPENIKTDSGALPAPTDDPLPETHRRRKVIVRPKWLEEHAMVSSTSWELVVSRRAVGSIRDLKDRDANIASIIERNLNELEGGIFSKINHIPLLRDDPGIQLYMAHIVQDLRLIYQIDCDVRRKGEPETQYIRIYELDRKASINETFWRGVASQLSQRGKEYRKKCSARAVPREKSKAIHVCPPMRFPVGDVVEDSVTYATAPRDDDPDIDKEIYSLEMDLKLHRRLATEKFVPFTQSFFEMISKNADAALPFVVSAEEREIINDDSSCLILGRSGTGKTTVMLFRMLAIEKASDELGVRYRQLFVTKSSKLVNHVKDLYSQLRGISVRQAGDAGQEVSLRETDVDTNHFMNLPDKFSELSASHFPLFVPFEKLCQMLCLDFGLPFHDVPPRTNDIGSTARSLRITSDSFASDIWPRLPEDLRKGFSHALVYSEIIGVIKGTEAAMLGEGSSGFLTREAYVNEDMTTSSVPNERDRDTIYTLFQLYKRRRSPGSWDDADRTHALVGAMRKSNATVANMYVDYIYMDEAQDNLIGDTVLLHLLCTNPFGLCFAGDTAQTISVGSAFKFAELKASVYRLERCDSSVVAGLRTPVDPTFYQLNVNYRSHGGIVGAAAYLVDILTRRFSKSIDRLIPESAVFYGPKPVFFSRRKESQFLQLISDDHGRPNLSHELAVLVRDKATEYSLLELAGDIGNIIWCPIQTHSTVHDSKGMEFDDVILYNFFTHSRATSTNWRALLSAEADRSRFFDTQRHNVLRSELKLLYVALTRARHHVYLWDTADGRNELEERMLSLRLVTSYEATQDIPSIGSTSTPDEWFSKGIEFFGKELYRQASLCFEKAGRRWWSETANAYAHRGAARQMPLGDPRRATFIEVAETFIKLAKKPTAKEGDRTHLLANAADCFVEAESWAQAAAAFCQCGRFNDALWYYRTGRMFDEALGLIQQEPDRVDAEVAENIRYSAKIHYTRTHQFEKAIALSDNLTDYDEFLQDHELTTQRIAFLKSRVDGKQQKVAAAGSLSPLSPQKPTTLDSDDRAAHAQLARIALRQRRYPSAVRRFLQSAQPDQARSAWLEGFWRGLHLGCNLSQVWQSLSALLELRGEVALSEQQSQEVSLIQHLAQEHPEPHHVLQLAKNLRRAEHLRSAVTAYFAWSNMQAPGLILKLGLDDAVELLEGYRGFAGVLNMLVGCIDTIEHRQELQALFGVSPSSGSEPRRRDGAEDRLIIHQQSPIFQRAQTKASRQRNQSSVNIALHVAKTLLRHHVLDRLSTVIGALDASARQYRYFHPCSHFMVKLRCTPGPSDPPHYHPPPEALTLEALNKRFRLLILMILVLDFKPSLSTSNTDKSRAEVQQFWLSLLFRICYARDSRLGDVAHVVKSMVEEFDNGASIVQSWCREAFLRQDPSLPSSKYSFMNGLMISTLLATLFDYEKAIKYLPDGKWTLSQPIAVKENRFLTQVNKPAASHFMCWVARNTPNRHHQGLDFLQHCIENRPAVEVPVILAFVEELCGQIVLNQYSHPASKRHGATLPASWVVRANLRGASHNPNEKALDRFQALLFQLLGALFGTSHSDDWGVDGRPLRFAAGHVVAPLIARICTTIVIVGLNAPELRPMILHAFNETQWIRGAYSSFYDRFFTCRAWDDLVRAVVPRAASAKLGLCNLISVRSQRGDGKAHPGIPVTYCDESEILDSLLQFDWHPSALLRNRTHSTLATTEGDADNGATDIGQQDETSAFGDGVVASREKATLVIQRALRRTRTPYGGPGAAAYMRLSELYDDSVAVARCIRGFLPHVANHLQTLADCATLVIVTLNARVNAVDQNGYQVLDNLRRQRTKARAIQKILRRTSDDIAPSSSNLLGDGALTLELLCRWSRSVVEISDELKVLCQEESIEWEGDEESRSLGVEFILRYERNLRSRLQPVPDATD